MNKEYKFSTETDKTKENENARNFEDFNEDLIQ